MRNLTIIALVLVLGTFASCTKEQHIEPIEEVVEVVEVPTVTTEAILPNLDGEWKVVWYEYVDCIRWNTRRIYYYSIEGDVLTDKTGTEYKLIPIDTNVFAFQTLDGVSTSRSYIFHKEVSNAPAYAYYKKFKVENYCLEYMETWTKQ